VQKKHPALSADNAFVFWFLRAFLVDDEKSVSDAVVGGTSDKGVDAIYVDHPNKKVFLIQGKYRTTQAPPAEKRSDIIAFANLARSLRAGKAELESLLADADTVIRDRLIDVYRYLHRRGYGLHLYFVTTGKVSANLEEEAQGYIAAASGQAELSVFGRSKVLTLLRDYLDGAAPPVPSLDLSIESGGGAMGGGIIKRYDSSSRIESWVFSMLGSDVGGLLARAGIRLFARNIRGYLGSTDINRGMRNTLEQQPENFWYFNNGVTMVCDAATRIEQHGREILRVFNPQIINGQQTTRILKDHGSRKAGVLVRVIAIPRNQGSETDGFERFVSDIVAATNWQNAIMPSDLRANDAEQVRIERELRRLNYQYLRKRQSKAETRRIYGTPGRFQFKKEDLAKAVAACEFDPVVVREGKERLFEEPYYSRIFCSRPAKEYLTFLRLDRVVRYGAKGKPERAYPRWLVLNFTWKSVKNLISKEAVRDRFLYICERRSQEWRLRYLNRFVDICFRAALSFFRAKRGTGAEAIDVSTFFKRVKLDEQFEKYWRSASNKYREQARAALRRFERELLETEIE
jgi:hypothetical protein